MIVPTSRRRFLAGGAGFAAALAAGRRSLWAAAPRPLVPREIFFGDPDISSPQLSIDGARIAYLAPLDGVRNLWVAPLDDPAAARPLTRAANRPIGDFQWAFTNRHIVFLQEQAGDDNWHVSSVDIADGIIVTLSPERGVLAYVEQSSHRFPAELLIGHNGRDKRFFDLHRVEIATGRSELFYENHEFAALATDSAFRLRLAGRFREDGSNEWLERRTSGAWVPLFTIGIGDLDGTQLLGFSDDGGTLYLLDSRGRDKSGLVAFDMATRRRRVLAEDRAADLTSVVFTGDTRRPLAVSSALARQRWQAVEPSFAPDLRALRAATRSDFGVSLSFDGRQALVFIDRDTASPEYGLYDRASRAFRPLFKLRKALDRVALRPLEPVVVPARDGLAMQGYLTLPAAGAPRVPMVLLVHGGPYGRDRWGFNAMHQWLANRGYAVLSVNFRGSTGFGKAFVAAADREWGGKMQDDLIDAVDWAVARGVADPRRIACYGGSYGGYAALTAATRTPEVFACIVDLFGVADLLTFMAAIPPYWGPSFSVWKNRVGDPDTEAGRAFLEERSPLTHIERAFRPILIAQGLEDVRVTPAESAQMVAALKSRNVPVTYITFPDEGHGFQRPENAIALQAVAEAFLARHLGGAAEPFDRARDFKGSTLTVETGGELIPGLGG